MAGVMLEISFARFRASIATFSKERAPSRPCGSWEFVAIVEVGGDERMVWYVGCAEEPEP